ncbi:S8 family serine peptidase [Actinoallomurus sp. NPDC052274]|uniref:S8 family serine peptidase n=1 Tax=Actinoallomurus sp. NPDC052274 TaxID=3155420 RepID=UPI0034318FDD
MRIVTRGVAAIASIALAAFAAMPIGSANADARPSPRDDEWWFTAWGIENMAWPQSTGRGMTVALIDSGVNADLPELSGAVVPGTDATGRYGGDGRKDTDTDLGGHGTGMAALIAGQGGPARVVGVAPDAKIMPIISDGYSATDVKAIRYAVDHGAQVINISQASPDLPGQTCPPDLQQAIADAVQKNVVIVAGAGNEGAAANKPQFPASCAGVLAVGAIDNKLKAWPDTERQSYVSAASPGWGVGLIDKNGRFSPNNSGTSQASALTSAAVALVRAKFPNMSAREVVQLLINTAVDAGPRGHDDQTGAGAILPPAALSKTVDKNAPNPPFERLDTWLASKGRTPSGNAPTSGSTSHKDSGGSIGLLPILTIVVLLAIVAGVVIILVKRRGGGGPGGGGGGSARSGHPPHPGAPGTYGPPASGPHGGGHPPVGPQGGYPPPGRPPGPPPSFAPPLDQDPPPRRD